MVQYCCGTDGASEDKQPKPKRGLGVLYIGGGRIRLTGSNIEGRLPFALLIGLRPCLRSGLLHAEPLGASLASV